MVDNYVFHTFGKLNTKPNMIPPKTTAPIQFTTHKMKES
jgi:hypothetical protein